MGTRGVIILYYNRKIIAIYCPFDSYFHSIGLYLLKWIIHNKTNFNNIRDKLEKMRHTYIFDKCLYCPSNYPEPEAASTRNYGLDDFINEGNYNMDAYKYINDHAYTYILNFDVDLICFRYCELLHAMQFHRIVQSDIDNYSYDDEEEEDKLTHMKDKKVTIPYINHHENLMFYINYMNEQYHKHIDKCATIIQKAMKRYYIWSANPGNPGMLCAKNRFESVILDLQNGTKQLT